MITYYDRLAALHAAGKITDAHIGAAVTRGWITQEQATQIVEGTWE